jgi:hypothetical protein
MEKLKTNKHNFSIEDDIWDEFKIYCIKNKTTATKIISDYIKKLVNKNGTTKRKIRPKK